MPGPKYGEFEFPASAGFHGSAGVQHVKGYQRGGPAKAAKQAKVSKVMHEFGKGELHSGSKEGPTVTNPKQAVAIALSEARRNPLKKATGGSVKKPTMMKAPVATRAVKPTPKLGALGQAAAMPNPMARARRPGASGPAAFAKGGDVAQDKAMVARGVHQHEAALHKGEKRTTLKLFKGGAPGKGFSRTPRIGSD